VKLQTYTADTLTINHNGPEFRIKGGLWDGYTLYDLYQEAHTPWAWHEPLFARAQDHGLSIFSSPFDKTAIDFLETLGAPAYKIASFEAVDLALIAAAAGTGKPMIISTGLANLAEIDEAITTARAGGAGGIAILHCVSAYPAPTGDSNLATIADLAGRFGIPVGLSDHTLGTAVSIAATALGACIIEKHVTLKRSDGGPDSAFSLEPEELTELVDGVRSAWEARGEINYERKPSEAEMLQFRRSLYVVADISRGETFSPANIRSIRPGYGLPPRELSNVLGQRATRDLKRGTPLASKDIET
jgi:pseudaminic acid synthase